jgi:hypothetical protein
MTTSPTDRLYPALSLALAVVGLATTTWTGVATSLVVLASVTARRHARRAVAGWSAAAGRGVLTASQQPQVLHASRHRGQAAARA